MPELAEYGAYSPEKTYSASDVRELVEYARVRGVKVLPEFDAPAHVGNGWQFAEKNHPEWGKLAVCVNQEEWQDYCVEPPCGQVPIPVAHCLKTISKSLILASEASYFFLKKIIIYVIDRLHRLG